MNTRRQSASRSSVSSFQFPVPAILFFVGLHALLAQMLLTRELLVSCFGSEWTIALVFAVWLAAIGAGAGLGRVLTRRWSERRLRTGLLAALVVLGGAVPLQVVALRTVRAWMGVPAAEFAPLGTVLAAAAAVLALPCLLLGWLFPAACALCGPADPHAVSRVYRAEALGSVVGGLAFAFGLAPWAGTLQIAAAATAAAWVAAAVAAPGALGRRVLAAAAATVVALAVCPHCLEGWEQRLAEARWRSFGVLPPGTAGSTGQRTAGPRLLASFDSRYQNLAVVESAGQRTLYGNGQVLFAWPDPLRYEHAVHFVMAQKPGARRVLLLGGNPLGHIPELLRYPLERLDWVELDDGLGRCLRAVDPAAYAAAVADPRVRVLHADGPRHVRACRERYDVVLVLAPEPVTSAANRYYTAGFYRRLRAVLAPEGFVYTTLETSEDLVPETARLAASVQRALASAFGTVLVVGGGPTQFFAGEPASGLTLDSAALAERSRGAGLATRYFRPAYFLHADELSAEKLAFVRERLARADGSANTELEPATYRAGLVRWLRQGGAGAADWLARVGRAGAGRLLAVCVALGLLGAAGFAWAARRGGGRARRSAALLTLAVAGFSGVAVELVLIYAVQGLYGYVYARMGLLVGLFMLGSALGAGTGRRLERASAAGARHGVLGLALVLPALAAALPGLIAAAAAACAPWAAGLAENGVALLVAVAGWAVGALFAGVCRQLRDTGAAAGGAAAAAETADYAGSALGALVTGAVLIPALGLPATCALVALLGACAAGWMLAART